MYVLIFELFWTNVVGVAEKPGTKIQSAQGQGQIVHTFSGLSLSPDSNPKSQTQKSDDSYVPSDTSENRKDKREKKRLIKQKKINVLTDEVMIALDRTCTSSRNALIIIIALLKALGIDIQNTNVSHSTIHRKRENAQAIAVAEFERRFLVSAKNCLTVHWDAKILEDYNEKGQKVNRLAIFVSGLDDLEELLAVPIIEDGTGLAEGTAVVAELKERNLQDTVEALF